MLDYALYIPVGLLVGVLVGLTGVGGGSLMTPVLVLFFGQAPAVAVGTDLVFAATTKVAATASFGYSRRVDWRIVGRLALGSMPAAVGMIMWFWLARRVPGSIDRIVVHGLAIMLVATALALCLQVPLRRSQAYMAMLSGTPTQFGHSWSQ